MMRLRFLAVSSVVVLLATSAVAQDYDRPPAGMNDDSGSGSGYGADTNQQDAAGLSLRVNRLEGRIREMTGQIEELQNANRKLVEQLQKFQADVDSRFSTSGPVKSKRSDAAPSPSADTPAVAMNGSSAPAALSGSDGATPKSRKRDDAFDPDTAPAGTPGKPKPLGSAASAQPDDNGSTPMDLSGGKLRAGNGSSDTLAPTLKLPSTSTPRTPGGTTSPDGTVVANINPASPRAEFDAALGAYKDKQYDNAEKGFASFIQKNPKSRLVADATYYLGETYAQRGRSREAAEQYLKISTDFANSSRAPDAMLHLGISLKALGAKEQACATFSEVSRKYPNAPAYVKSGVERESKRAQC